jgi:hypothetical protein
MLLTSPRCRTRLDPEAGGQWSLVRERRRAIQTLARAREWRYPRAMQGPAHDTPTHDLVVIGLHHLAALEFFDETSPLVEPFRAINDKLLKAFEARTSAERSHAPAQAQLPLVDIELDAIVMALAETVKTAASSDALFEALFPAGLQRVVDPIGVLEAEAVDKILATLESRADAAPLRDPWAGALRECLDRYRAAIGAREDATGALDRAMSAEEAARKAWFAAVGKHCGTIEETFPDTPVTEAVFFAP